MSPLVVVTVGTDHHRFDRLMEWIESWLAGRAEPVRCVVQHGTSRQVAGAECHPMLAHQQLQALMAEADAVVCQGGPGGITETRSAGRLPIVVPRTARLKEHVDDHQVRFTQVLATRDRIALAASREELHAHLDAALADPSRYRVVPEEGDPKAVLRFGELVDELLRSTGRTRKEKRGSAAPDGVKQ